MSGFKDCVPLMFCGIDSKVYSKDIITSQVLLTLRDIPRFCCNHFRFGMKHKARFGSHESKALHHRSCGAATVQTGVFEEETRARQEQRAVS